MSWITKRLENPAKCLSASLDTKILLHIMVGGNNYKSTKPQGLRLLSVQGVFENGTAAQIFRSTDFKGSYVSNLGIHLLSHTANYKTFPCVTIQLTPFISATLDKTHKGHVLGEEGMCHPASLKWDKSTQWTY